jgi:thiamine transporter ThiT
MNTIKIVKISGTIVTLIICLPMMFIEFSFDTLAGFIAGFVSLVALVTGLVIAWKTQEE